MKKHFQSQGREKTNMAKKKVAPKRSERMERGMKLLKRMGREELMREQKETKEYKHLPNIVFKRRCKNTHNVIVHYL